jgi:hypothetical protein
MQITDPLKRRAGFLGKSMQMDAEAEPRNLMLLGNDASERVILTASDDAVMAMTPLIQKKLKTYKIQILDQPSWLIIDFDPGYELSRIVVDISELDSDLLGTYIKRLIGDVDLLYFNHSDKNKADV